VKTQKKARIHILSRILLILSCLGLIAVLFVPLWKIDLAAPQYPEGLSLLIYPNNLGGNVDIINGLNHYIGMKTLHTKDFFEFTILPYIIIFFAAFFLVTAIVGSRSLMNILLITFIAFGIIAMVDFWRWEYNYGHNLNPEAAIIVPGMSYQPPLIGYKQLLNFSAYSLPNTGGWLFIGAGVLLLFCVFFEWRKKGVVIKKHHARTAIAAILISGFFSSCNTGPEPIKIGVDNCHFCKMTVTDAHYGAEIVTQKGKVYKFDDTHCLLSFLKTKEVSTEQIKDIYLVDFDSHDLEKASTAFLLKSEELKTPMGGNVAAFAIEQNRNSLMEKYKGSPIKWEDLMKE
jgi:copper chaperone NosL